MLSYTTAQLAKYHQQPLLVKETLDLEAILKKRDAQIIAVQPVLVQGQIGWKNELVYSQLQIKTHLTYPSTRSLTPVNLPIDIQVEELYSDNPEILKGQNQEEEKELILSLENQRLNLQTAIEDNILLSIPTQVLTPQEQADKIMPHGQQWSVISEDQYQQKQKQTLNPQWDKLKDFIPKDKQ